MKCIQTISKLKSISSLSHITGKKIRKYKNRKQLRYCLLFFFFFCTQLKDSKTDSKTFLTGSIKFFSLSDIENFSINSNTDSSIFPGSIEFL